MRCVSSRLRLIWSLFQAVAGEKGAAALFLAFHGNHRAPVAFLPF